VRRDHGVSLGLVDIETRTDADVENILGQPQFCFGTAAQRKTRGKPRHTAA